MAAAMIARFLIMYWPSRVGTSVLCHVWLGKKTSGPKVVIIWIKSNGMTTLSAPRIKNKIPIRHSNKPNKIKNVSKFINGIVLSKSRSTTTPAGESPRTFKIPNQKNTTKSAIRATGIETFLKK